MTVTGTAWYVQWFLWNCDVLDRFVPLDDYHRKLKYSQGTNLCHLFRTMLWGSLISVLSVSMYAFVIYTLLILPLQMFSLASVAVHVIMVVAVLTAMIAAAAAVVSTPWLVKKASVQIHQWCEPQPGRNPGFHQVIWQFALGVKNKFCPRIQFRKDAS